MERAMPPNVSSDRWPHNWFLNATGRTIIQGEECQTGVEAECARITGQGVL
jgi:hypothetical protein